MIFSWLTFLCPLPLTSLSSITILLIFSEKENEKAPFPLSFLISHYYFMNMLSFSKKMNNGGRSCRENEQRGVGAVGEAGWGGAVAHKYATCLFARHDGRPPLCYLPSHYYFMKMLSFSKKENKRGERGVGGGADTNMSTGQATLANRYLSSF